MIEFIISTIFVVSICGILVILARKIPAVNTLPKNGSIGIKKHRFIEDIEMELKKIAVAIEKQVFLHKMLSMLKVMIIKVEVRVDNWLHKVRKRAQQVEKNLKTKK